MRTFIAIPLPEECRRALEQMQQSLRSFHADVRWTAIPSIHLTLRFLGEADPAMIPGLAASLAAAAQATIAFTLRLRGLGCFPNFRNPRVIWCGIDGETGSLAELQKTVESVCAAFGFEPEARAFQPHLTLGRVNGKRNLQPLLDCIKMGSNHECSFKTDAFNIYRSTLKPQGAIYDVLETIALST